jgi:hypothetical protein
MTTIKEALAQYLTEQGFTASTRYTPSSIKIFIDPDTLHLHLRDGKIILLKYGTTIQDDLTLHTDDLTDPNSLPRLIRRLEAIKNS